jgi:hypothetical protein
MPTKNTYHDAYLARQCTDAREDRAYADVDALGTFDAVWRDKLATLRTYIIACLECQAAPDDLFGVKLKHYRVEFDACLGQAKSGTVDESGSPMPVFSVPILRG